jgi:O-antigen ligase
MNRVDIRAAKSTLTLCALAAFLLTLWRFGANQCLALVAVIVIFYRPWREQLLQKEYYRQPVIWLMLLFLGWAVLSLSYAQTPSLLKAAQGLTIYSKLLFLIVLPLAMCHAQCRYWVEQGLIYGVFVNACLSTLYYFQINFTVHALGAYFPTGTFAVNALQMVYVAVLACWILSKRILNHRGHWIDGGIFIFLSIYIWFVNIERSGYLLYLALLLLSLYQTMHKKGLVIGIMIIPILLIGLYEFSPNVKTRVALGVDNLIAFHQAQDIHQVANTNSLGLRLAFAKETWIIAQDHLLLGTGIGSFRYVNQQKEGLKVDNLYPNDPHNAYSYVLFELGLVGLFIYLAWLGALSKSISRLPLETRDLMRGIWWAFVIMGFTDSGFALNAIGLSFILCISAYLLCESSTQDTLGWRIKRINNL